MAVRVADISRRAAVGGLAAAGAGFVLFGPRGPKENGSGRIALDYWEKWTGHEGRAMQKVVDEFNASQSRIFVRYLVTAGIDQKTLIAVAGGNPPDVVGLWNYNIPLYAETNAILPLDDLLAPHGVTVETYATGVRKLIVHPDGTGRSRMWATVNTCGTVAMYYNRAHFREVGLDADRPPLTIPELDAAARKLDVVGRDGTIKRAGFLHTEPGWWSWFWGYSFGGTLYEPGGVGGNSAGTCLAASPENAKAFEWMQATCARYGEGRLGPERTKQFRSGFGTAYDSALNGFLDGKCSMVVQGPWLANVIEAHRPGLGYGVCAFPTAPEVLNESEPIGLIDSDVLVVPRGVKDPEACAEFIAYTQRQEVVEFLSTAHFKNSSLANVSEGFLASHPNKGVRVHTAIAASPRGFVCPRTRIWPQFKDEFDASMQRIWNLERPAVEELELVRGRVQRQLTRVEEMAARRSVGQEGGRPEEAEEVRRDRRG